MAREILKAGDISCQGWSSLEEWLDVHSYRKYEWYVPGVTQFEYVDTQSRWVGTGYETDIFRIVGTDDALLIYRNEGGGQSPFYDDPCFEEGYFAERRAYGKACGELAKKYKVPFELVLAIGPREKLVEYFAALKVPFNKDWEHELTGCGIARRKSAITEVIGETMAEKISLSSMGQINSARVARYLTTRFITSF